MAILKTRQTKIIRNKTRIKRYIIIIIIRTTTTIIYAITYQLYVTGTSEGF